MKLHISQCPGFGASLYRWEVMLPLTGRGHLTVSWGDHSMTSKRHTFAMPQAERAAAFATLQALPAHLGAKMDCVPFVSIRVESEHGSSESIRTLYPAPTTDEVAAFDAIVDAIWPDVQAAFQGVGLTVSDWREGPADNGGSSP